jgi:hypothetical protein
MVRNLVRFVGALCLAWVLIWGGASAGEPGKEVAHQFNIAIIADLDMDTQGKTQKIVADTEVRYQWARTGRERVLTFESMRVKASIDGKHLMDSAMSREKMTTMENGKAKVILIADAPDALKSMLEDSFGAPMCKLRVDENGKETKRTVVAGPGAKALIDGGVIANAVLFHPPYLSEKDEWQADADLSVGNGAFAKGKLAYKKVKGGDGGQAVRVSGTLTNDGYKLPANPLTHKVKHVVSGTQTYDPAQKEWIAGKFTIDVSMQASTDDAVVVTGKGTMVLNFKKLPGKK